MHSESPVSSSKRAHNNYKISLLFVEFSVLKWSVWPRMRAF